MPNYITNRLKVIGNDEEIKEVLNFIKIEKGEVSGIRTIDFNKITPMPKWVYGSNPNVTGISREDYEKYGEENTCLEWARKNWGTKWNAFSQGDKRNTENTIYFETAWNGIPALIQKIAWIFPDVEIEYSYFDEDFGRNLAKFRFKDTEVLKSYCPEKYSKEAYDLALEIEQGTLEEHNLKYNADINNYEYYDEDEI